jgi:hypothetical protein
MADYIFLMHDDANVSDEAWAPYIRTCKSAGTFKVAAPSVTDCVRAKTVQLAR